MQPKLQYFATMQRVDIEKILMLGLKGESEGTTDETVASLTQWTQSEWNLELVTDCGRPGCGRSYREMTEFTELNPSCSRETTISKLFYKSQFFEKRQCVPLLSKMCSRNAKLIRNYFNICKSS